MSYLKILVTIALTAIATFVATMFILDSSELPENYNVFEIDSKILNETREVIVSIPRLYQSSDTTTYTTIYVVGGSSLTYRIAYDTDLLFRAGLIPPTIVVGISNNQESRKRDLTPSFMKQDLDEVDSPLGRSDQYLEYLATEVIPLIERDYRASDIRLLVGHSREGLFVVNALTERQDLFDGHLCLSPALWRESDVFVDHFRNFLMSVDSLDTFLFMSMGQDEVKKMISAYEKASSTINELTVPGLRFNKYDTPSANHESNPHLSVVVGLVEYFREYPTDDN